MGPLKTSSMFPNLENHVKRLNRASDMVYESMSDNIVEDVRDAIEEMQHVLKTIGNELPKS